MIRLEWHPWAVSDGTAPKHRQ